MNTNAFQVRQLAFALQRRETPLSVEDLQKLSQNLLELVPFGSQLTLLDNLQGFEGIQTSESSSISLVPPGYTIPPAGILEVDFEEVETELFGESSETLRYKNAPPILPEE